MLNKSGNVMHALKIGVLVIVVLSLTASMTWAKVKQPKIKVMTRNLYLGADIFKVVDAAQIDPDSVPYAVAEVFQTMLQTNFWERAEAIADEIARTKPQVVGLQEVSSFYIQTPGDFMAGNPVQADTEVIDFYKVLNAALRARKMHYKAFININADVELPMVDPSSSTYLSDVRMVDHDVILVRKAYPANEVLSGNYEAKLALNLGGAAVEFIRGFIAVDVEIKGAPYRFVNTHLEVRSAPGSIFRLIQYYQMLELLGTVDYLSGLLGPKPVILVGDFNSAPEDVPGNVEAEYGGKSYIPPYMLAVGAGYLDTWLLQRKYDEGYTSGFDEYVSDPYAELTTRIDLIFLDPLDSLVNYVKSDVVGDELADMTAGGLWPSDHAGVVSMIKLFRP